MPGKCLIEATGWIGDTFFALSLPKKLKEELGFTEVHFVTYRLQPWLLLQTNTFIDKLYFNKSEFENSYYDKVFTLPTIEDKTVAPTVQFQKFCGIVNTSTEFEIITNKEVDKYADYFIKSLNKQKKDIITYQGDWDYRLWLPSEEELRTRTWNKDGLFSHYRSLRPINFPKFFNQIKERSPNKLFIEISPFGNNANDPRGYCTDPIRYAFQASLIKQSNIFLGAEGGLSNLAAGIGVKTIISTDHVDRMYGTNGVISQCSDIQLGPKKLFPTKDHIHLDPFLSIPNLINEIVKLINE